jgi:vacuolar protein sorting-associated protein 16
VILKSKSGWLTLSHLVYWTRSQEAARIFGLGKDNGLHRTCTEETVDLLKDQEVLRTKYGVYEVAPETTSVAATISNVLRYAAVNVREQHRLLSDADKISRKFRVPEKRFWFVRVKAFAESEQWSNLRLLADSKKSPIGYKPFARAAINGGQNVNEVNRYIERIAVPEEKYDLFCETKQWQRALDEAAKLRDGRRIINVKNLCQSTEIQLLADQTLARIA